MTDGERTVSKKTWEPVEIFAGMICQEGKDAALEIAESAGCEAALDAMKFISEKQDEEIRRLRSLHEDPVAVERAARALDNAPAAHPFDEAALREVARAALRAALNAEGDDER